MVFFMSAGPTSCGMSLLNISNVSYCHTNVGQGSHEP